MEQGTIRRGHNIQQNLKKYNTGKTANIILLSLLYVDEYINKKININ